METTGRRFQTANRRRLSLLLAGVLGVSTALVAAVWTADVAHAQWRTVSGVMPDHVSDPRFTISPDSATVVYTADIDTAGTTELYAASLAGGPPIKLNPPLVAGGDVQLSQPVFTPDSQHIVYLADQEVDNRVELYSVPIAGGAPTKLNAALVAGGNVNEFKIDAGTGRVVYVADQATNDVFELWSVPLAGGSPVRLNGSFTAGGDIGMFKIDPLSDRVVYSADQDVDGVFEVYSAPLIGGSTYVKLNPPIVLHGAGDSGIYGNFDVNPTVPVVVLIAREAGWPGGRLYMVPTAGGPLTQLSFNPLSVQRLLSFKISPVGDRVVFNMGSNSGSTFTFKGNLYSALIGGGGAANITESAVALHGTDTYFISPDGQRVVYSFQNNAADQIRLESATLLGARTVLYDPPPSSDPLFTFRISPDSDWVVYDTTAGGGAYRANSIAIDGGQPVPFGASRTMAIMPDSSRLIYAAREPDGNSELISAQIFGGGTRDLSGMGGQGYVSEAKVSANGASIVFLVQLDLRYEIRVSDGDVPQPGGGSVVTIDPVRLFDSRPEFDTFDSVANTSVPVTGGTVVTIPVAGRGSIPSNAAGAVLNLTATQPAGPGFLSVYPCTDEPQYSSAVNYTAVGQTVPNLTVAQLSPTGAICVFALTTTHVVIDATGFLPAGSSLHPIAPVRRADTRPDYGGAGPVAAGQVLTVDIAGTPGIPSDAAAAVINLTVDGPAGPGFATAYPCDAAVPSTSTVNYTHAGHVVSNAAVVKLSSSGTLCVFVLTTTHVIVDVVGYAGVGAALATIAPTRLADTRPAYGGAGPVAASGVLEVQVAGRPGIPSNATTAILSVTVTEPTSVGFATIYACSGTPPTASNLNYTAGQTVPNAAVVKLSASGTVCIFTLAATHLIVDATGYQ